MYEQSTRSSDYFQNNDLRANKILTSILYCFLIVWPIMALSAHLGILHIAANDFYLPCIVTLIADMLLVILQIKKAPFFFIKYYCLVTLEIIIGAASIYPAFNISILYGIAPVASCIYFNKELTCRISFFGYFMMIIGLIFRTHKFISSGQTAYTYLQWFTSSALSYTIEYLILALVCFAIASRSRVILEDVLSRKQKIQAMQEQIIFSFANLIESKDNVTGQHVKRTSAYVRLIATELKKAGYYSEELNDSSIEYICMAAPVHDIGKMKIPDSILCKPSSLTDSEFHFMKTHTFRGEEIIQKTMKNLENDNFIFYASNMAMYHHEKWDGSGYPEGLTGCNIPLCARIMAVADVFDALVTKRSYKDAMSIDEAMQHLKKAKGTQFEPLIVDVFIQNQNAVEEIYKNIT